MPRVSEVVVIPDDSALGGDFSNLLPEDIRT